MPEPVAPMTSPCGPMPPWADSLMSRSTGLAVVADADRHPQPVRGRPLPPQQPARRDRTGRRCRAARSASGPRPAGPRPPAGAGPHRRHLPGQGVGLGQRHRVGHADRRAHLGAGPVPGEHLGARGGDVQAQGRRGVRGRPGATEGTTSMMTAPSTPSLPSLESARAWPPSTITTSRGSAADRPSRRTGPGWPGRRRAWPRSWAGRAPSAAPAPRRRPRSGACCAAAT